MSNLLYLLCAYIVFWALTFVLVFSIWMRQRRLEREIAALQARLEEIGRGKGVASEG
jgi:uncharacterized membrane protein